MTENQIDPDRWYYDPQPPVAINVLTVLCVVFLVAALVVFAVAVRL